MNDKKKAKGVRVCEGCDCELGHGRNQKPGKNYLGLYVCEDCYSYDQQESNRETLVPA